LEDSSLNCLGEFSFSATAYTTVPVKFAALAE